MPDFTVTIGVTSNITAADEDEANERGKYLADHLYFVQDPKDEAALKPVSLKDSWYDGWTIDDVEVDSN